MTDARSPRAFVAKSPCALSGLALLVLVQSGAWGCATTAPSAAKPVEPARAVVVEPSPTASESLVTEVEEGEEQPAAVAWRPGDPVPPAWLAPEQATRTAPDRFRVRFDTTKGSFVVEVERSWAPGGVDRFYNLVSMGYYTDVAFFRAIQGFMVQFGIHGVPEVNTAWRAARIPDDPVVESNTRGKVTFAMAGPNTRTVQLFINLQDNGRLDGMGFSPIGAVVQGMDVVDGLYVGYGEGEPMGAGPSQATLQAEGNAYLRQRYPNLDYILSAQVLP